jgi:hypothetical protein
MQECHRKLAKLFWIERKATFKNLQGGSRQSMNGADPNTTTPESKRRRKEAGKLKKLKSMDLDKEKEKIHISKQR